MEVVMIIKEKVIEVLYEQLCIQEDDEITLESKLVGDLGCDSLDQIELAMEFESIYDIEIPDDDIEKLSTVQDVIDYIEKAVA